MVKVANSKIFYLAMSGLIIGDTFISIILKIVPQIESKEKKFHHAYFLTLWFFIGQIFWMCFYYRDQRKLRSKYGRDITWYPEIREAMAEGKNPYVKPYWIAIPALMDVLRTAFFFIAIVYVPCSVINMMGALVVLVTAALDKILLGKRYLCHHYIGMALIVTGVTIVTVAITLFTTHSHQQDDVSTNELIFGISMMVLSAVTQGIQFVSEEMILHRYHITPMRMIGWEGIWGTLIWLLFLVPAQFIKCSNSFWNYGRLEDSVLALNQVFHHWFLIVSLFLIGASGFLMNVLGVLISKISTAAHRATINQIRVVLVWIWFLFFHKFGTGETFLWTQLLGFIILLCGVLTFNEILKVPFLRNRTSSISRGRSYLNSTINEAELTWEDESEDYVQKEERKYLLDSTQSSNSP